MHTQQFYYLFIYLFPQPCVLRLCRTGWIMPTVSHYGMSISVVMTYSAHAKATIFLEGDSEIQFS